MRQLKVIFLHARGTKVHLWTLEIPSNDIQVLEYAIGSEIPLDSTDAAKVLNLGNFVWKLRGCIHQSCQIISKMKQEHDEYLVMKQMDPEVPARTNLSTLVEREIQKPVKGSQYVVLLPE